MFANQNVIITGGSSGVGKLLAERMLRLGANLALLARDQKKLDSVKAELEIPADRKLETFSCDVVDEASVTKTIRAVADSLGPPQVLVNSAGILREGYFEKIPGEVFSQVMQINFFGTLNCIRAVLPYFKQNGSGRIINMSSLAGVMGVFGYSAYCSSKYAVKGLSDTLRLELKPQNIDLHVVCAPEFDSPMVDDLNRSRTPENRELIHTLPVLTAEEVAQATLTGIRKNRYLIIPGRKSRMAEWATRRFPRLSRRFMDRKLKKIYRGPA